MQVESLRVISASPTTPTSPYHPPPLAQPPVPLASAPLLLLTSRATDTSASACSVLSEMPDALRAMATLAISSEKAKKAKMEPRVCGKGGAHTQQKC